MAYYLADGKAGYQPLTGADVEDAKININSSSNSKEDGAPQKTLLQRVQRVQLSRTALAVRVVALAGLTLLLVSNVLMGRHIIPCRSGGIGHGNRNGKLTVEERVDKILAATPLIDGHNDFPIAIRERFNNHINNDEFRNGFERDGLPQHVDLPRLRAGKNGGAFWSVFTPCPKNGTDFSDENYVASVRDTLLQIDLVARLKIAYPDVFSPNVNSSTALAAFEKGQLISPLGIEGLHQIGNSVSNLRLYYALGVRYATLTHNVSLPHPS